MPRGKSKIPDDFNPLGNFNKDEQKKYAKRARRAHSSPKTAIELKCLECCAGQRAEAKICQITRCPLWAYNRKIFGDKVKPETEETPDV